MLPRKQSERSDATRSRLVSVAHDLFGRRGYDATSVDDLVAAAGVTKGAFYHHFDDKEAVFRLVFEEVVREIMSTVAIGAAPARCAKERASLACRGFLVACRDPVRLQITMHDGPRVLGHELMRQIEWNNSLASFQAIFEEAVAEGGTARRSPTPLAHIFFGALCEGVLFIAGADDPDRALAELMRELDIIVEALIEGPKARSPQGVPVERKRRRTIRTR